MVWDLIKSLLKI